MGFLGKSLLVLAIGLAMIAIQGTMLQSVFGDVISPNLVVILVVYLAFHDATAFGALLVFLVGLEFDIACGKLLGPWAGAFLIVFSFLSSLSQRILIHSGLTAFCAVFASSVTSSLFFIAVESVYHNPGRHTFWTVLVEGLITGLLAPPVFFILTKIFRYRERHSGRRSYRAQA